MTNHTQVIVSELPQCDIAECSFSARYDARTVYGSWANLCALHFKIHGTGLGLGKGQELILEEEIK